MTGELLLAAREERMPCHADTPGLPMWVPVALGAAAALILTGLYLGIVMLAESWTHAVELLQQDAPFVVPMVLGFGAQIGLFAHLRVGRHIAAHDHTAAAVTGASGATSTATMVACCAHHLTDILPVVGLSGAAVFLADYKIPFLILGLISNFVGVSILLTRAWQTRAQDAVT